mmetsp:Transcript_16525/g.43707  ORF Transcript_16525/g.43707 Transcript_16525/m.43707 type:complete len:241 (+) Transcript_16525:402-1124(+)
MLFGNNGPSSEAVAVIVEDLHCPQGRAVRDAIRRGPHRARAVRSVPMAVCSARRAAGRAHRVGPRGGNVDPSKCPAAELDVGRKNASVQHIHVDTRAPPPDLVRVNVLDSPRVCPPSGSFWNDVLPGLFDERVLFAYDHERGVLGHDRVLICLCQEAMHELLWTFCSWRAFFSSSTERVLELITQCFHLISRSIAVQHANPRLRISSSRHLHQPEVNCRGQAGHAAGPDQAGDHNDMCHL